MKKYILINVFLLLSLLKVKAQVLNLPSEPDPFIDALSKQLEKNLGTNYTKQQFPPFESFFRNSITDPGKKEIITISQTLTRKGASPNEVFKTLLTFKSYFEKGTIDQAGFATFVSYLQKTYASQTSKKNTEIINQLYDFINLNQLYTSNFNKLKVIDGSCYFKFWDKKQDYFNPEKISEPTKVTAVEPEEDLGWGDQKNEEEYDPWNDPALEVKPQLTDDEVIIKLPKLEGLIAVFESASFALVSPSDSIIIKKTSGAYDFINGIFVGEKGHIDWLAANENVEADLDKYYLKAITGKFLADKVIVTHENILKKPVEGVLEIKLEKRPKGVASSYPRFKSYKADAELILNIPAYVYKGGYTLIGSEISSVSLHDTYTKLIANKGLRNQFEVIGRKLIITDSLITSDRVSFLTKFDKDSVSHPAVKMQYRLKDPYLQLNKVERGGYRNSMYSDTFHQVDIKSDAMYWDLSGGKMNFYIVAGKTEIQAVFESFDYFNPDRFRALSNAAGFNPLMAAGTLFARKKVNSITINEMVAITKKERFQVSNGMLIGHQMGFFDYNPYTNTYSISRKGQHYYLSHLGKKDFDDLVLTSLSSGGKEKGNASIDLTSKSLDINGAQDFKLSDSLGISFIPTDQSMKIVGNKIFTFNGQIAVKNFRFYGDFEVQYENFLVKLNRIDSITFIPLDIYRKGGKKEIGGHFVYGKTGTLYLNSPTNKSGRKKLSEYPKLEIPGGVLVYFNEKERTQKFGKDLFFKSPSIKIDSLNDTNPVFTGVFNFGKIMQPINENLRIQSDSSMGLKHVAKIPYKLFGTESTLKANSDIILDYRGIRTSGDISHLAGRLNATDVKLFEDHLTAKGNSGKINESGAGGGAYFPDVVINEYDMFWEPALDSMSIGSEKGFKFYAGSTQLKGSVVLRKSGLFGEGLLERQDSDAKSNEFKFNKSGFLASNAIFNIKSNENKPVFSGRNVGLDYNIERYTVNISSQKSDFNQSQTSSLEFPFSSYKTTIDNAVWNIKDKKISMKGELANSMFSSTATHQFGLMFNGTGALYDIAENNLKITGVEEIHSADAAILPPKGFVQINKEGRVEPFENAKIIADTLNRYHTLTNASVKINSKISFAGNADYQFVNVSSDTFNIKLGNFEFAELTPDGQMTGSKSSNKLSTIAKAKITEKDSVYLSPKILYKGDITMLAPFKNLSLRGQVIPDLKKYPMFGGAWINYAGNKSEAISINVDETLKDGGKPLWVGLHMKYGALQDGLYPSFLSPKINGDDMDVFYTQGVFKRDEPNKKFIIGPADENAIGNRYEFYDDRGIVALEGRFNLLGAPSKIFETVGVANIMMDSMKYQFATLMKFDFPLSIPNTQKLGQNIVKANLDAGNSDPAIVPESPIFQSKLNQYIGQKELDSYRNKAQKEHQPLFKTSNKFLSTMVLSDLNLQWNRVANAYYSVGPIGISNIGDVDINAMVNGYVEILKNQQTGDEINVMFEISPTVWYYFVYKNGQFGVTSSDEEINKILSGPPTGKEKKSEVEFMDVAMAVKYKKRFLQNYLGIKETEMVKKPGTQPQLPGTLPAKKAPTKKEEEKEGF